jgi:hypothetical protein
MAAKPPPSSAHSLPNPPPTSRGRGFESALLRLDANWVKGGLKERAEALASPAGFMNGRSQDKRLLIRLLRDNSVAQSALGLGQEGADGSAEVLDVDEERVVPLR